MFREKPNGNLSLSLPWEITVKDSEALSTCGFSAVSVYTGRPLLEPKDCFRDMGPERASVHTLNIRVTMGDIHTRGSLKVNSLFFCGLSFTHTHPASRALFSRCAISLSVLTVSHAGDRATVWDTGLSPPGSCAYLSLLCWLSHVASQLLLLLGEMASQEPPTVRWRIQACLKWKFRNDPFNLFLQTLFYPQTDKSEYSRTTKTKSVYLSEFAALSKHF